MDDSDGGTFATSAFAVGWDDKEDVHQDDDDTVDEPVMVGGAYNRPR